MIVPKFNLSERLVDLRSPDRRPRRAAYALPTLFTAGNLFLGFYAILRTYEGSLVAAAGELGANRHFEIACIVIGIAVFLDGLDGRIARLTNTVSEFGREMDSLADCITFGIAPAVLAFAWGIFFVENAPGGPFRQHILRVGVFVCFLYLLCGAARLARFNIQTNPIPKNPGRPDRKYFVGLPIPAAAGMVAASIYATDSAPLTWWIPSVGWVLLLAMLSFLMVSTWRYRSFKDFNLLSPRSFKSVILLGSLIYLILYYSQPVLLGMAIAYVGSGIAVRLGGVARRRFRPSREEKPQGRAEHQVG